MLIKATQESVMESLDMKIRMKVCPITTLTGVQLSYPTCAVMREKWTFWERFELCRQTDPQKEEINSIHVLILRLAPVNEQNNKNKLKCLKAFFLKLSKSGNTAHVAKHYKCWYLLLGNTCVCVLGPLISPDLGFTIKCSSAPTP